MRTSVIQPFAALTILLPSRPAAAVVAAAAQHPLAAQPTPATASRVLRHLQAAPGTGQQAVATSPGRWPAFKQSCRSWAWRESWLMVRAGGASVCVCSALGVPCRMRAAGCVPPPLAFPHRLTWQTCGLFSAAYASSTPSIILERSCSSGSTCSRSSEAWAWPPPRSALRQSWPRCGLAARCGRGAGAWLKAASLAACRQQEAGSVRLSYLCPLRAALQVTKAPRAAAALALAPLVDRGISWVQAHTGLKTRKAVRAATLWRRPVPAALQSCRDQVLPASPCVCLCAPRSLCTGVLLLPGHLSHRSILSVWSHGAGLGLTQQHERIRLRLRRHGRPPPMQAALCGFSACSPLFSHPESCKPARLGF